VGVESAAWNVAAWLATYALHSTVLIAVAWLAVLALSRVTRLRDFAAGIREWMWKLALFGGLATATAQVVFSIETWRLEWIPSNAESTARVERAEPAPAPPTFAPIVAAAPKLDLPSEPGAPRTDSVHPLLAPALLQIRRLGTESESAPLFRVATMHAPAESSAPTIPSRPLPWIEIALGLWLTGIAIGLVRWAREWQRLARCVRGRVAIESGLVFRDLETLRKRAGSNRRVRLSCAPGIAAPITMGVLRAEICLPPRALRALQRDEIRAVLAHELAHAVRRDTAWLCLCRLLEIAFFFQPLNRVARRFLQEDVETLCDDWAVVHTGECVPLASSLTEIAGWIVGEHRRLPATAMVVHGSALSHRVRRLLDEERAPVVLRGRMGLTAITSLCCAGAALALPGVSTTPTADRVAALEDCADADECDERERSDAGACHDCGIDEAVESAEAPATPLEASAALEWNGTPLLTGTSMIATLLSAADVEPLDVSGLLHEIDSLQHGLDTLKAEATLFGADELQERIDALATRLESLRAMQARLDTLLEQYQAWPLLDRP
jgi:beta-lactamase regulating signal transducer with metallopeptidase domain